MNKRNHREVIDAKDVFRNVDAQIEDLGEKYDAAICRMIKRTHLSDAEIAGKLFPTRNNENSRSFRFLRFVEKISRLRKDLLP